MNTELVMFVDWERQCENEELLSRLWSDVVAEFRDSYCGAILDATDEALEVLFEEKYIYE